MQEINSLCYALFAYVYKLLHESKEEGMELCSETVLERGMGFYLGLRPWNLALPFWGLAWIGIPPGQAVSEGAATMTVVAGRTWPVGLLQLEARQQLSVCRLPAKHGEHRIAVLNKDKMNQLSGPAHPGQHAGSVQVYDVWREGCWEEGPPLDQSILTWQPSRMLTLPCISGHAAETLTADRPAWTWPLSWWTLALYYRRPFLPPELEASATLPSHQLFRQHAAGIFGALQPCGCG